MGRPDRAGYAGWARGAVLAAALLVAAPPAALAHGGAYQPPPQPRRGDGGPGPTTPGGGVRGPVTPGGGPADGPTTGGTTGDPPPPLGPTGDPGGTRAPAPPPPAGARGRTGLVVVDFNDVDWARWWFANRLLLLRRNTRAGAVEGPATPSATMGAAPVDPLWRAAAQAALGRALAHENRSIASAAAVALGKSGDAGEAGALVDALRDDERPQTVREAAALGLGLLPRDEDAGGRLALAALRDVAADEGERDRLRAMCVYALGLRGDPASVPFLVEVAESGDATWDVPAAGVAALGLGGHDMLLPDLLDMLEGPRRGRSREAVRRAYAAQALCLMGDARAVPVLREVALQRDEHARRAAVLALGAIARADDEKTIDVLLHLLANSRDTATRSVAALALGRSGSWRAGPALLFAYRKGSRQVRPFAAIGLGLLARHSGLEDAAEGLLHDLRTRSDPRLRAALCVAVGLAGESRATPILLDIVEEDGPTGLRAHAAFALGQIGDRDAAAVRLRRVLEETREPELQREVSLALGLLRDREALRILGDLVRHGGSAYVQGSAAVAVGRIGGRESVDALVELLEEEEEPDLARAMAAVGLGLVLDRSEGRQMARIAGDLNWWLFTPTVLEILSIH